MATKDRSKSFWICFPKVLALNLIRILSLPSTSLPSHKRALNGPGSIVSIQEMRDALVRVGGEDKLDYIEEAENTDFDEVSTVMAMQF